jgi:hypothetical protein
MRKLSHELHAGRELPAGSSQLAMRRPTRAWAAHEAAPLHSGNDGGRG